MTRPRREPHYLVYFLGQLINWLNIEQSGSAKSCGPGPARHLASHGILPEWHVTASDVPEYWANRPRLTCAAQPAGSATHPNPTNILYYKLNHTGFLPAPTFHGNHLVLLVLSNFDSPIAELVFRIFCPTTCAAQSSVPLLLALTADLADRLDTAPPSTPPQASPAA